jgi:hypothetical protein
MPHIPGSVLSAPLLLLALAYAECAGARTQDGPGWSVSGFGTLGLVHASERHADYTSSAMKHSGAGATRRWSADVDSRFGLQLDLALNRRWSGVLQVVSEQGLDNSYRPRVEWANIKYQATPELALRAGRIALPMFLTAEYRKVGYVYPWVRPPVEGYGVLPFTSADGVEANYRWSAGSVRNSTQLFWGHEEVALAGRLRGWGRHIAGLASTCDWRALSVRASLVSADATTGIGAPLFDGFAAFGVAGEALGRRYRIDHKRISIASIGANYDPGQWFLMAEASGTRSASLLGSTRSVYASAGWRHQAFTPWLTWSHVRAVGPASDPGLALDGLAAPAASRADTLNAGLNLLLATVPRQVSLGAGLRWDLRADTALKFQYDRVTPHGGSRGTLINPAPGFRSGRTTHVASVAADFVY